MQGSCKHWLWSFKPCITFIMNGDSYCFAIHKKSPDSIGFKILFFLNICLLKFLYIYRMCSDQIHTLLPSSTHLVSPSHLTPNFLLSFLFIYFTEKYNNTIYSTQRFPSANFRHILPITPNSSFQVLSFSLYRITSN